MHMSASLRPLRQSKVPRAARAAARSIKRAGLNPEQMQHWAEQNVITLLNLKPNGVTKRITGIVEACAEAIRLTERISHFSVQGTESSRALKDQRHHVLVDLNARLARYKWNPVVRNCPSANSYFHIAFEAGPNPILAEEQPYDKRHDFNTPEGAAFFEHKAAQWIVQNIAAIHRVRCCRRPSCGKWFFGKTDHQKYCGDTCRKRDASHGESFKKKRAAYMKEYRKVQAERDEKAKQLAKGKDK